MSTVDWPLAVRRRSLVRASRAAATGPLAPVLIVLLGVMVRAAFLTLAHAWGGIAEYDDTVHFGAAELLFAGRLPYRDFVFLQPPGIIILLQPLAALARIIGEDQALIVARAIFVAIGAVNIALVWKLLRPRGAATAIIGAGFYAVWFGTASTERTILLEPLLNLGLLITLLLLRRGSSRATVLSGIVLGLTCTVKLWPLVFVAVIVVWIARARSLRMAARFAVAAMASFMAVIVPFWIAAGRCFPDQVVFAQLGRSRFISLTARLQFFDGLDGGSPLQRFVPIPLLVIAVLLFVLLVLRMARRDREIGLWSALLFAGAATLAFGSSFFYHYPAFMAVPLAALVGCLGVTFWSRLSSRWRSLATAGGAMIAVLLAVAGARGGWTPQAVRHEVPATAGARCVWADSPALLITIDHFNDQTACSFTLDVSGLVQLEGQVKADRAFQAEFMHADAALLLWGGPATQRPAWTPATVERFEERFEWASNLPAGISLWKLRAAS